MEKFPLCPIKAPTSKAPTPRKKRKVTVLPDSTWETLHDIKVRTGMPMYRIVAKMVDFCVDRLEIVAPNKPRP